jgi:hypothetical protein
MNSSFIYTNSIRIIILLLIQIFLLDILPFGYFYIMIYPCAILLLPVATPRVAVIIIAFLCGIILDTFSNGYGLHTASITLLGYLRFFILKYFQPKSGWGKLDVPNIYQQGLQWFVYYILISIFIHHSFYFLLESFSAYSIIYTIKRLIISIILSSILTILINLLFLKDNKH